MKRRFKITIAFDGTAYAGYQYQDNGPSVQARLEEVLSFINCAPVRIYGSSRTDAGVHARGFVAHFDLNVPIPPKNLPRAMNTRLPEDIRVLKASYAKDTFNAQFDAKGKEYRYFLYNAEMLPPHMKNYWAFKHRPLNIEAMQDAASRFVGSHDFVSFAANPHRPLATTVRTITSFVIQKHGPRITFIVRGDGFLYKQVRSMVGFLIQVGLNTEPPEAVTELLEEAAPRIARVPTAPGRGLVLWKVFY